MATTHSRVSVYSGSSINTVYTNSTAKPQRILLTDMHFWADSASYGSDMGGIQFYVVKRSDNVSYAMTSTVFYAYIQYTYSLWANFTTSIGAGSLLQSSTTSIEGLAHVYHQGNTYGSTPWSSIGLALYPVTASTGQSTTKGMGQCVLYPGDTLRIATNKNGTAYMDFLIMSE